MNEPGTASDSEKKNAPGWICPFCGTDASPLRSTPPCDHLFVVDGENGWRFTSNSLPLFEAATARAAPLFRDLLYHDPACRAHLRLLRALYEDSLEIYVWTDDPAQTIAAFTAAIERTGR